VASGKVLVRSVAFEEEKPMTNPPLDLLILRRLLILYLWRRTKERKRLRPPVSFGNRKQDFWAMEGKVSDG
jgi:hypothetical protein